MARTAQSETLKRGAKGPGVEALQDLLNRTGALLVCDGDFGIATENGLRECQGEAGLPVTGVADAETRRWLAAQPEPSPDIPAEAVTALVRFEVGSRVNYNSTPARPHWPGGQSGVTIGLGYDLRHHAEDEFRRDWGPYLAPGHMNQLAANIGRQGSRAAADLVNDIVVPFKTAWRVFCAASLPKYVSAAKKAFPGFGALPPLCRGALVSLVYNRGAGMNGDDRREMRAIRDLTAEGNLAAVPDQFDSMKRLWPGVEGLRLRRGAEAAMWRKGLHA